MLFFLFGFSFTNLHYPKDSRASRISRISLTPLYQFYPLHRYLEITQAITAESLALHKLAAGLEPRTYGFPAQVANH